MKRQESPLLQDGEYINPAGNQIVSLTYETGVEGENTRLRHYLQGWHPMERGLVRQNPRKCSDTRVRLLLPYLKFWDVPIPQ
jgi:hypothetical protein